jgi:hypothetical protein
LLKDLAIWVFNVLGVDKPPASESGRYKTQRAGRDAGATKNGFLLGIKSSHTDSKARLKIERLRRDGSPGLLKRNARNFRDATLALQDPQGKRLSVAGWNKKTLREAEIRKGANQKSGDNRV